MRFSPDTLFLPAVAGASSHQGRSIPWQRWGEGGGMSFTRTSLESRDHLILCDNLSLLGVIPTGAIDLVYIDPPFATGKVRESSKGSEALKGFEDCRDDPAEFVQWLAPRLAGLWRILAENGSLVIHLDTRAVHHARVWCDAEFGSGHWENEIIWHYTGGGRSKRRFSRKHDVLLWYSKGPGRIFNVDAIREPYEPTSGYAKGGIVSRKGKKYMPHPEGKPADDVWDIPIVNPMASERSPYPTQKPLRLLERLVSALSEENAVVCDAFCGSGTTALACRGLGRRFICCDSNPDAIGITLSRLREQNPDAEPPAVLSTGFYRLPFASSETADVNAARLMREGLRIDSRDQPAIVFPAWREKKDPPYPLGSSDAIADIRSVAPG